MDETLTVDRKLKFKALYPMLLDNHKLSPVIASLCAVASDGDIPVRAAPQCASPIDERGAPQMAAGVRIP